MTQAAALLTAGKAGFPDRPPGDDLLNEGKEQTHDQEQRTCIYL